MNSRKPSFDDGLGDLIRETFDAKIGVQEPSDTIWHQIEDQIEDHLASDDAPVSRRGRLMLSSPVAQVIFVVFLVVIGGLSLQRPSISDEAQPILIASLPQPDIERYIDEYSAPSIPKVVRDEVELYTYKPAQVDGLELGDYPVAIIPLDVMPHPLSPEGRLLDLGDLDKETSENIVEVVKDFESIVNQVVY